MHAGLTGVNRGIAIIFRRAYMFGMSNRKPLLAFRIDKDLLKSLQRLAKAKKLSLPEYMRVMVSERVLGLPTAELEKKP